MNKVEIANYQKRRIEQILKTYDPLSTEVKVAVDILRLLGIEIAFNWIGHRGEWFFPTDEDKEAQEDWMIQCTDYD